MPIKAAGNHAGKQNQSTMIPWDKTLLLGGIGALGVGATACLTRLLASQVPPSLRAPVQYGGLAILSGIGLFIWTKGLLTIFNQKRNEEDEKHVAMRKNDTEEYVKLAEEADAEKVKLTDKINSLEESKVVNENKKLQEQIDQLQTKLNKAEENLKAEKKNLESKEQERVLAISSNETKINLIHKNHKRIIDLGDTIKTLSEEIIKLRTKLTSAEQAKAELQIKLENSRLETNP